MIVCTVLTLFPKSSSYRMVYSIEKTNTISMVILSISADWIADFQIVAFVLLFIIISILTPKILKEKGIISKQFARKIVHAFSGLAALSAPFMNHPILSVLISASMTVLTLKSSKESKTKALRELFDAIGEDEEIELGYLQGPFAYCLAVSFLVFIFIFYPDRYYFPISAIFIMMYADPMASVIGKKYGKHRINVPGIGNKRSVEGSIAFFLTSLLISGSTFLILGQYISGHSQLLSIEQIILFTVIMSTVATILELLSPSKYDDIIVPLGLTLLVSLPAIWFFL